MGEPNIDPVNIQNDDYLKRQLTKDIWSGIFGGWWIDTDGTPVKVRPAGHRDMLRSRFKSLPHSYTEDACRAGLVRMSYDCGMLSITLGASEVTKEAIRTLRMAITALADARPGIEHAIYCEDRLSGDCRLGTTSARALGWLAASYPEGGWKDGQFGGIRDKEGGPKVTLVEAA